MKLNGNIMREECQFCTFGPYDQMSNNPCCVNLTQSQRAANDIPETNKHMPMKICYCV